MAEPREIVESWYEALRTVDLEGFVALHHDDVVYNIVGRTEISGRWHGKDVMFGTIVPKVFAALDPQHVDFANPSRVFAVDGNRVVGLMRGGGVTTGGEEYEQTYCHLFEIRDGRIGEVWEFFDTELAQARLFGRPVSPDPLPESGFSYS